MEKTKKKQQHTQQNKKKREFKKQKREDAKPNSQLDQTEWGNKNDNVASHVECARCV